MNQDELKVLEERAKEARVLTIDMIGELGIGHVGGAMSIIDVLTVLYYKAMKVRPDEPKWEGRDRLVLSKGHAGPALYSILAMKGFFDKKELKTLNKPGTNLPSHCDMNRTKGIDMTTGSLGQGISAAVGMAIGSKIDKKDKEFNIFAIIGDGESQEGQVWEAAMVAGQFELDNLIAFTDYNKMQIDGTTHDVNTLEPLDKRWESFGWNVQIADGHDYEAINTAIEKARASSGKPNMIILDTVKGKGVSFAEGKITSHNMAVTKDNVKQAMEELNYKL